MRPVPPVSVACFAFDGPEIEDDTFGRTSAECAVHHVSMVKRKLPIGYGFPAESDDGFGEAWSRLFPNAWEGIPGGCVVRKAKFGIIFVCPQCCAARDEWLRQRAKLKGGKASNNPVEPTRALPGARGSP